MKHDRGKMRGGNPFAVLGSDNSESEEEIDADAAPSKPKKAKTSMQLACAVAAEEAPFTPEELAACVKVVRAIGMFCFCDSRLADRRSQGTICNCLSGPRPSPSEQRCIR